MTVEGPGVTSAAMAAHLLSEAQRPRAGRPAHRNVEQHPQDDGGQGDVVPAFFKPLQASHHDETVRGRAVGHLHVEGQQHPAAVGELLDH